MSCLNNVTSRKDAVDAGLVHAWCMALVGQHEAAQVRFTPSRTHSEHTGCSSTVLLGTACKQLVL